MANKKTEKRCLEIAGFDPVDEKTTKLLINAIHVNAQNGDASEREAAPLDVLIATEEAWEQYKDTLCV